METKENWISPEGYSLKISQLNQDVITGDIKINLNNDYLVMPFEGLINICYGKELEFCFVIDWDYHIQDSICYTTFVGKNYFENSIEYIGLRWLLVHEGEGLKIHKVSIKGKNRLFKASGKVNNLVFANESNNVPYPFFMEAMKTKPEMLKYDT
ncbi:hypothetical protein QQ020_25960 [Fulvivirgaceae bacterium BMA12]|uniref:Uncharacterized protein n=1 Tax=Agaribacillus aureus TaxID=3051825 RepID=A0ABT8LCP3_9BACT|nr:hypothetical protein [Fulvivirgaceae bacterium BMA12]